MIYHIDLLSERLSLNINLYCVSIDPVPQNDSELTPDLPSQCEYLKATLFTDQVKKIRLASSTLWDSHYVNVKFSVV